MVSPACTGSPHLLRCTDPTPGSHRVTQSMCCALWDPGDPCRRWDPGRGGGGIHWPGPFNRVKRTICTPQRLHHARHFAGYPACYVVTDYHAASLRCGRARGGQAAGRVRGRLSVRRLRFWGVSSNGRATASHAVGKGIDTPTLHFTTPGKRSINDWLACRDQRSRAAWGRQGARLRISRVCLLMFLFMLCPETLYNDLL